MLVKSGNYSFDCSSAQEEKRARTLFVKESGTIAWLEENSRPGAVFFDVGANIGIYSVVAGVRGSRVHAFEPHSVNFERLKKNLTLNGVDFVAHKVGLGDTDHEGTLNYRSLEAGTSGSQVGHNRSESGEEFTPLKSEPVEVRRLDSMRLEQPDFIKIDVDGNEIQVLMGMVETLGSGVQSVQIEIHPRDDADITNLMRRLGYALSHRHHTTSGKAKINLGADPLSVTHNAVFKWIG